MVHLLFQGCPTEGYNIPGADKVFNCLVDVVKHCRKTPIILPNSKGVITFPCPQPKISDEIPLKKTEKPKKAGGIPVYSCCVFHVR